MNTLLFTIENFNVIPSVYALSIEPYKLVWDRDKTPEKKRALQEFRYITFVSGKTVLNPFVDYADTVKHQKVVAKVFPQEPDYTPDSLVNECINDYVQMQIDASIDLAYYTSLVGAVAKLTQFFEDVDFSLRNNRGTLLYSPKEVSAGVKEAAMLLKSLDELKKKVELQSYNTATTRMNRAINQFERMD